MTTSGTINTTSIPTSKLLEKAMRRIGLLPGQITPEIVSNAQESLFMLLMSMSNRGLNLWCVDKKIIPLEVAKATYVLPTGTQSVLNLVHGTPTLLSGTDTPHANHYTIELSAASKVVRINVKFSVSPASFAFQTSADGVTWVTVQTFAEPSENGWYDIDPAQTSVFYRVLADGVTSVQLAESVREIMVSKFNRDDYANQPNKNQQSNTVTNYYFEKLISPQITVWPVPNDANNHLVLFRYRMIQDVGTLTQTLEIPSRWLEAITWHLALRLAFEVPGVDPARRAEVNQMAQGMVMEVEEGETDNAPSYFAPNVGVYTR